MWHTDAIMRVAHMYERGEYIDQDPEKALEYYFIAEELGHSHATIDIGRCYLDGIGTKKDYEQALKVFNACYHDELMFEDACFFIGYMKMHGYGYKQDILHGLSMILDVSKSWNSSYGRRFVEKMMLISPSDI